MNKNSIKRKDPCPCKSGKKYKNCHEKEDKEELLKKEAKRDPAPQYLYKYCPCKETTKENIKKNQLWFSDIQNLNDPAEFTFNKDFSDRNRQGHLKELARGDTKKEDFVNDIFNKGINTSPEFLHKNHIPLIDDGYKNMEEYLQKSFKIFSCSENSDIRNEERDNNILLWSHYSDSHKGLCIEYEKHEFYKGGNFNNKKQFINLKRFSEKSEINRDKIDLFLAKIDYQKESPYIFDQNGAIALENTMFTKFGLMDKNRVL